MINTKCSECMFAHSVTEDTTNLGCSKKIIHHIQNIKNITQDSNGFNVIENYACRFGFSKQIYEANQDQLSAIDFEARLLENSTIRYYLLLDCIENINFDHIINILPNLPVSPKAVSFMFRSLSYRPFNNQHQKYLVSNYKNISWKAHNFIEDTDLEFAIDHILSTNAKLNQTSYFLVYNASNIDRIQNDVAILHEKLILHQEPMIAAIDQNHTLYRLAMSFENYKVAKNLGSNLIDILVQEQNILYY